MELTLLAHIDTDGENIPRENSPLRFFLSDGRGQDYDVLISLFSRLGAAAQIS